MTTLLDAARQALDTLTHIIGMRHLSFIGQAMAESAERTLRTAIAEAEKAEPAAWAEGDNGIPKITTGYSAEVTLAYGQQCYQQALEDAARMLMAEDPSGQYVNVLRRPGEDEDEDMEP